MAKVITEKWMKEFPARWENCDKQHANKHFINGVETVFEALAALPDVDVPADIIDKAQKCPCYRVRTEIHHLTGEERLLRHFCGLPDKKSVELTVGRCQGTAECEICHCSGDKSECDFYPHRSGGKQ